MKTLGMIAVIGILSTPALAFDPPTHKPMPDTESYCARVAWENTRTLKHGVSFPVDVAKAEKDLAYIQMVMSRLPDDAPERDVYYFLIPSECEGGVD